MPSARQDTGGKWFSAADPLCTKPGNGTYKCCPIYVPFAHRLLSAHIGAVEVEKAGTLKAELMQADDGDTDTGTQAGSDVADATMVDSADKCETYEITLAAADKVLTSAGRYYWILFTGTNAADFVHMPSLALCVQPDDRSTL
jgi:hypothetical protein